MEQTTHQQQAKNTYVTPDDKFATFLMQAFYDKVYKLIDEDVIEQAYANLRNVTDDFEEAKLAASFLGIDNFGENDAYVVNEDLEDTQMSITLKQAGDLMKQVTRKLIKEPSKTHFGIMFLAGHGLIKDGR